LAMSLMTSSTLSNWNSSLAAAIMVTFIIALPGRTGKWEVGTHLRGRPRVEGSILELGISLVIGVGYWDFRGSSGAAELATIASGLYMSWLLP
jgi:hypothetical protein